jgi:(2Fe-2S) ferredoxin
MIVHPTTRAVAARRAAVSRYYLKKRAKQAGVRGVRINNAGCLDRCALGPVLVIYPEGIWYGVDSEADIDEIVESHLVRGEPVERLRLTAQQRSRHSKPAL